MLAGTNLRVQLSGSSDRKELMKRRILYAALAHAPLLFFGFLGLWAQTVSAQDDRAALEKLMKDDSETVNVIALYDNPIRTDLFVAAGTSEGVARISDLQKTSNEGFKRALSSYSKEDQARIWNMTRFGALIGRIVQSSNRDQATIDAILRDYPEEIHADARYTIANHPEVLASVDMIRRDFDRNLEIILGVYPDRTRQAFQNLVKNPDALTTLNDNMRMSVLLGDLYKRNPELVQSRFSELNLQLANRKAKDLEEWRAQMQSNPDAQSELKQSAQEFAESQGYAPSSYANTQPAYVEHYVSTPYAYWSGYPWWYESPCWVPYPAWYHWGFYYSSGSMVWYGTPSWYFLNWHFRHSRHFSMYPHITNCYFDYFYWGPPRYYARCSWVTHRWYEGHRHYFADDFRDNHGQRIERIRDLSTSIGPQRSGTGTPTSGSSGTGSGRRTTVDRPGATGSGVPRTAPTSTPNRMPSNDPVRSSPGSTPSNTPFEQPRSNPRSSDPVRSDPGTTPSRTPVEQPRSNPRSSEPSSGPRPSRDVPQSNPHVDQPHSSPSPRGAGVVNRAEPRSSSPSSSPASPRPSSAPHSSERPSGKP